MISPDIPKQKTIKKEQAIQHFIPFHETYWH